jgi:hypothetical protein
MCPKRQAEFDLMPVLLALRLTELLAKYDDRQEYGAYGQPDKGDADEAILEPETIDPRRNAVPDGKAHGVSYENDGRQPITRYLAKRIDQVRNREGDTSRATRREDEHGEGQSKPVNLVRRLQSISSEYFLCSNDDLHQRPKE